MERTGLSDREEQSRVLLALIARKDKNAFARFYELHYQRVRAFVRRKGVANEEVQDELCQEVFLKIWNRASFYDPAKGQAITWVASIVQNSVYDLWRKMQRAPLGEAGPEKSGEDAKLNQWLMLDKALTKLKAREREIFRMVFIQGMTMKQCAECLGVPTGTIKWRVSKLQKALMKEVAK